MTSISCPFFAVSMFILQKFQQGIPLPKRIPHPLKALLPPAPLRSVWDLNEKKIAELETLWNQVSEGRSTIPAKTGREAIQKVCKKATVMRQMYECDGNETQNEAGDRRSAGIHQESLYCGRFHGAGFAISAGVID